VKVAILGLLWGCAIFVACSPVLASDPVSHETVTRQRRPRLDGEKFDPQESDPRRRSVFAAADAKAERAVANVPRDNQFISRFWTAKKEILRRQYEINWKTPAELNPTIIYDSYGQPRLTSREISEVTPTVKKLIRNPTEKIESFERDFDGAILVWTRVGKHERGRYTLRKDGHFWKVTDRHRVQD
jgi:hypothetical protein